MQKTIFKEYLKKYGYSLGINSREELLKNPFKTIADIANNMDFVEMVKLYQSFFNLNATGKLDMETVKQMLSPRCGMPDIFHKKNPRTSYVGRDNEEEPTTTTSTESYKKEAQKLNAPPSSLVSRGLENQQFNFNIFIMILNKTIFQIYKR